MCEILDEKHRMMIEYDLLFDKILKCEKGSVEHKSLLIIENELTNKSKEFINKHKDFFLNKRREFWELCEEGTEKFIEKQTKSCARQYVLAVAVTDTASLALEVTHEEINKV